MIFMGDASIMRRSYLGPLVITRQVEGGFGLADTRRAWELEDLGSAEPSQVLDWAVKGAGRGSDGRKDTGPASAPSGAGRASGVSDPSS